MRSLIQLMMGRNLMSRRISSSNVKRYMMICSNIYYHHHQNCTQASPSSFSCSSTPAYSYLQASPFCFLPVLTNHSHDKYHDAEDEPIGEFDMQQPIVKGDVINLHQLLFTKGRDYLVKCNDDRQVKASQLAGKVIVLYFLPLHYDCYPSMDLYRSMDTSYLRDIYTYLLPENVFEVVLVAYGSGEEILLNDVHSSLKKRFEAEFSLMPWTAIPFSDIRSRERLVHRFGIDRLRYHCTSVVVDSTGMILQSDGGKLFERYGGLGYPYSDERIDFIKSEDERTARNPQLKALLGSPKRNYVISNKGDKVLIDSLKEKVVGIYFYEEGITPDCQTKDIMTVYEEFAQNKSLFEVVLIYLYDTNGTIDRTSETTFCNTFKTMPWLALPFKDPKCGVLRRILGYPFDKYGLERAPTLVIIGPDGRFIEPWGADVIRQFKLPAFPFTREKVVMLDNEKVKELTLDMLWDRNAIFRQKNGREVRFSELDGKRIILFFEGNGEEGDEFRKKKVVNFLGMLKERYFAMINKTDQFEVIYIANSKMDSPYSDQIVDAPWFVSHASELLPIDLSLYCCYCHLSVVPVYHICSCCKRRRNSSMLAFDEDGGVVRKSIELSFGHLDFPFYNGSMKKEAFLEISNLYDYIDADRYHEGILINSYFRNFKIPHIYR